jgi:energy-converting hydrogenase Eha subunit B
MSSSFTLNQAIGIVAVAAAVVLSHLGWMTTDQFFGVCATAGVLKLADSGNRIGANIERAAAHHLAAAQVANLPVEGDDSKVPAAPVA